jgi:hypothetical protein
MTSPRTSSVTVYYDNEEVQTSLNLNDYKFNDLDSWIRSRFGLSSSSSSSSQITPLRYMNKVGEGKLFLLKIP